eukprot:COSAG04_NODE_3092_length_3180_cov_13.050957_3_plen_87_part_00
MMRHTGASAPTWSYVGRQPIKVVEAAIVKMAVSTAGFLPILSPIAPKSTPPIGLKKKAIQNTANVFIRLRISSSPGKNASLKSSAK